MARGEVRVRAPWAVVSRATAESRGVGFREEVLWAVAGGSAEARGAVEGVHAAVSRVVAGQVAGEGWEGLRVVVRAAGLSEGHWGEG